MKEGPGSSLILGPAKGSLVDLQLERPNIHSVRYNPVTLAVRSVPTAAGLMLNAAAAAFIQIFRVNAFSCMVKLLASTKTSPGLGKLCAAPCKSMMNSI